jgi:hypothetical protein
MCGGFLIFISCLGYCSECFLESLPYRCICGIPGYHVCGRCLYRNPAIPTCFLCAGMIISDLSPLPLYRAVRFYYTCAHTILISHTGINTPLKLLFSQDKESKKGAKDKKSSGKKGKTTKKKVKKDMEDSDKERQCRNCKEKEENPYH